jgi:plastocyanin
MRRALPMTAVLLLAVFAWAPRAASEPARPPDAAPAVSPDDPAAEEEVIVRIRGRQFLPETVQVHAGRKTRLIFRNQDAELHAFVPGNLFNGVSLNIGGNGAPEFGDHGFRKVIIPGEGMAELRFVLQQPGRYPYICDMPGHEMRATIVVE